MNGGELSIRKVADVERPDMSRLSERSILRGQKTGILGYFAVFYGKSTDFRIWPKPLLIKHLRYFARLTLRDRGRFRVCW